MFEHSFLNFLKVLWFRSLQGRKILFRIYLCQKVDFEKDGHYLFFFFFFLFLFFFFFSFSFFFFFFFAVVEQYNFNLTKGHVSRKFVISLKISMHCHRLLLNIACVCVCVFFSSSSFFFCQLCYLMYLQSA